MQKNNFPFFKGIDFNFEEIDICCPKHGHVRVCALKNSPVEMHCPLCREEDEVKEKSLREKKQREELLLKLGIREKHFEAAFDLFYPPNKKSKEYVEQIKLLAKNPQQKIVLLYGNSGTGKTMLLSAAVIKNKGLYTTWEWLSMEIRASYSNAAKETEYDILRRYCTVPFLAIDEIEKGTDSEAKRNTLSFICRERYENNLPLWMAGNCNSKWVGEMFDTSVIDRLKHSGMSFNFDWDSYRENLKNGKNENNQT